LLREGEGGGREGGRTRESEGERGRTLKKFGIGLK
jgi:hypothetical protein